MRKVHFRIPFLQKRAVGIHITDKAIRWIELEKTGNRHKIINSGNAINQGDWQSSLLKLLEQEKPGLNYVSVNLDSNFVKSSIIPAPSDLDENSFNKWIENKFSELTESSDSDEWVFRYQMLEIDEDQRRCFIAAVQKKQVEKVINSLNELGLTAEIITCTHLAGAYGFYLTPDFLEDDSFVLQLFEGDFSFSSFNNGVLNDRSVIRFNPTNFSEVFDEVELIVLSQKQSANHYDGSQKLYLLNSDYLDGEIDFLAADATVQKKLFSSVEQQLFLTENGMSNDFSIALGLAMKQLYPDLDSINFLEPVQQLQIHEIRQKRDVLTAISLQAILLLIFVISALAIRLVAGVQLNKVQQAALEVQDKLNAIELMEAALLRERAQYNQVQYIAGDMTDMSFFMELIGSLAPDKLWFREVAVKHDQGRNYITVKGLSLTGAEVFRFMGFLEQAPRIQEVALRFSERVQAESFYSSEQFRLSPLTSFEIHLITENRR